MLRSISGEIFFRQIGVSSKMNGEWQSASKFLKVYLLIRIFAKKFNGYPLNVFGLMDFKILVRDTHPPSFLPPAQKRIKSPKNYQSHMCFRAHHFCFLPNLSILILFFLFSFPPIIFPFELGCGCIRVFRPMGMVEALRYSLNIRLFFQFTVLLLLVTGIREGKTNIRMTCSSSFT
jgi:hypothetical protein